MGGQSELDSAKRYEQKSYQPFFKYGARKVDNVLRKKATFLRQQRAAASLKTLNFLFLFFFSFSIIIL